MACLHLGEPSCRWFNRFLDRSSLFGEHGFLDRGRLTVDDAELVGGVLVDAADPSAAARDLAALLRAAPPRRRREPVSTPTWSRSSAIGSGSDPRPHRDGMRPGRRVGHGPPLRHGRRAVGSGRLAARRDAPAARSPTHHGRDARAAGRPGDAGTLRLAAPFIDQAAISFLADSLAAATARGVSLEVLLPTRSTHAGCRARRAGADHPRRGATSLASRVAALRDDAPWAHLKVLTSDSIAAYIGSANVTGAGIGGHNLELGILVRGDAVAVEEILDLFRA